MTAANLGGFITFRLGIKYLAKLVSSKDYNAKSYSREYIEHLSKEKNYTFGIIAAAAGAVLIALSQVAAVFV